MSFNAAYPGDIWVITSADHAVSASLPWNVAFNADTEPTVEAEVNIGLNLGASVNFIQPIGVHSPTREIGGHGETLFITRTVRNLLMQMYYQQIFVDGYVWLHARTPYTGSDPDARVFMHPVKAERDILGHGDLFKLTATFRYIDIAQLYNNAGGTGGGGTGGGGGAHGPFQQ